MQKADRIFLIGIGYRPLSRRAKETLKTAEVVLSSNRLLDVFMRYEDYEAVKGRIRVINNVDETIAFIRSWLRSDPYPTGAIALLSSGDPLFFGIGRRMIDEFGRDSVEIIPDLSSIQEAFARIKLPWDDAFLVSLHGGPDPTKRRRMLYEIHDIPRLHDEHAKIAVLTDKVNNPSEIGRVLSGVESKTVIHVCERLGYPDERIITGTPGDISSMTFSDPNVVIIQKSRGESHASAVRFGLREDEIIHDRGLITKDEARAVALHKLRLPLKGVFWDLGAGSGAVSIEASLLSPGLRVFAVEKEPERVRTIRENVRRMETRGLTIVQGTAPEALLDIPTPDRVFIGGSGGNLGRIIELVSRRMLAGIVVANAATLETLNESVTCLEQHGFSVEFSELLVSRSKIVAGKRHMAALNPVFIVKGERF